MTTALFEIIASFAVPMDIANSPLSLLWIIPLVVIISTVYKATKFEKINSLRFVRESIILTGTILGFMLLIAVALYFVVEWIT